MHDTHSSSQGQQLIRVTQGLYACVDWLNVRIPVSEIDYVRQLLVGCFGVLEPRSGSRFFHRCGQQAACGAMLAWTPDSDSDAVVSLPGGALQFLGVECAHIVIHDLLSRGQATRLDCTLDSTLGEISMDMVRDAGTKGNYSGPRSYDERRQMKRNGTQTGNGVYFGSRLSTLMLRVYDKGLETKGKYQAIRFEAQLGSDRADATARLLFECEDAEEMAKMVAKIVVGSTDFVDRSSSSGRLDRTKRLPWWQNLAAKIEGVKPSLQKYEPPLQRTMQWWKDSCTRFLAKFIQVIEHQGMDGEKVMLDMIHKRDKEAAEWQPGAKNMAIDLPSLLQGVT